MSVSQHTDPECSYGCPHSYGYRHWLETRRDDFHNTSTSAAAAVLYQFERCMVTSSSCCTQTGRHQQYLQCAGSDLFVLLVHSLSLHRLKLLLLLLLQPFCCVDVKFSSWLVGPCCPWIPPPAAAAAAAAAFVAAEDHTAAAAAKVFCDAKADDDDDGSRRRRRLHTLALTVLTCCYSCCSLTKFNRSRLITGGDCPGDDVLQLVLNALLGRGNSSRYAALVNFERITP